MTNPYSEQALWAGAQTIIALIGVLMIGTLYWKTGKLNNLKWYYFIVPTIIIQLIIALFYNTDQALIWVYEYDGGEILPYGKLWFLLNPYWWTQRLYMLIVFGWEMFGLGCMLILWRKGKISLWRIYAAQLSNMMFVLIHNPQSISPMNFVYMASWNPLLLIIAALIKLPFGWNPPIDNTHVACALGKIDLNQGWFIPCVRARFELQFFLDNPTLFYNWFVYLFQASWIIASLWTWWKQRAKSKKDSFKRVA